MIQSFVYTDNELIADVSPDQLAKAYQEVNTTLWVDIQLHDEAEADILRDVFQFHPLAIEDCIHDETRPKLDDFGEYLFLVMHGINFNLETDTLKTTELDIFLGSNSLITVHKKRMPSIESTREYVQANPRFLAQGADALLHRIIDALVDNYHPTFETIREAIEDIETQIFDTPKAEEVLPHLFRLKKDLLYLRRRLHPQWEVIRQLATEPFELIQTHQAIYFSDINDHIARLNDLIHNYNELIDGAVQTYLLLTSYRLNEVMRVLTIIATIMMPLTLIVGIYGMNFDFMPELHWRPAYFIVIGVMVAIALGMVRFFRKRGWM